MCACVTFQAVKGGGGNEKLITFLYAWSCVCLWRVTLERLLFILSLFLFIYSHLVSFSFITTTIMAPANETVQAALVAGHLGHLTPDQTTMLKQLWDRILELFEQTGDPNSKPAPKKPVEEAAPKKSGGFFSRGKKEPEVQTDLFIGSTTDPNWLSLPLEKAMPLIPGKQLHATFWNMVATDNPDAVMLRFLRARKWDLDAAYNMLSNTLRWRLVMRVDDIVALGETGLHDELEKLKKGMGESFIWNLKSGKAYLGGPDKDDRGIW